MIKINSVLKAMCLVVVMTLVSLNAWAKNDTPFFVVQISNYSGFFTQVPPHNIHYSSDWPAQWTDGPVEKILQPNEVQNLELWSPDEQSQGIWTNLVITDPAANNRVIFKGQANYRPSDKSITLFIRKVDENYMVIPYIFYGTDKTYAFVQLVIYDKPIEPLQASSYLKLYHPVNRIKMP